MLYFHEIYKFCNCAVNPKFYAVVDAREGFVVATTTVLSLKGRETTTTAVNDRCSCIKSKTIRTNEFWTKCLWTTIFRMSFFQGISDIFNRTLSDTKNV